MNNSHQGSDGFNEHRDETRKAFATTHELITRLHGEMMADIAGLRDEVQDHDRAALRGFIAKRGALWGFGKLSRRHAWQGDETCLHRGAVRSLIDPYRRPRSSPLRV